MNDLKDKIDVEDFAPAYYQLARILNEKIMNGKLRQGDRLPPETSLCEEFGLSRMTVRRAIAMLEEQGLLYRQRGKGTFIKGPPVDGGMFMIPDFHQEMSKQGIDSTTRLLAAKVVKAGEAEAENLKIKKGDKVVYMERVMEAGGEPLVFDRKFILYDPSRPFLEEEIGYESSPELFSGFPEMQPVRADLTLSVTILNAMEAELLNCIESSAAFRMEQLLWAANDLRVAWGWMLYRGDRFEFHSLGKPI